MHLLRMLPYRLADALRALLEKGLSAGLTSLGQLMVKALYQHSEFVVVANVLSDQVFTTDPRPDLVIRQIATRDEVASLSPIADWVDMERFHKMFECGSVCFSVYQNDQIVGYAWISQEVDRSVNRVQPPLCPGDVCVHDLFVLPSHRRQGIGQALVSHRLRFLREHGYTRAIAAVRKGNAPALRVDKKTGYIPIGHMSHTRILFWDSFRHSIPDT